MNEHRDWDGMGLAQNNGRNGTEKRMETMAEAATAEADNIQEINLLTNK